MLDEIRRDQFLANPREFAKMPSLVVAIVAGNDAEEPALLESWALLKQCLNGAGARIGYRAFLALLQDSESDLRTAVVAFSEQGAGHPTWRFVAAPIEKADDCLAVLQEIEWRAHKDVEYRNESLRVVGAAGAL